MVNTKTRQRRCRDYQTECYYNLGFFGKVMFMGKFDRTFMVIIAPCSDTIRRGINRFSRRRARTIARYDNDIFITSAAAAARPPAGNDGTIYNSLVACLLLH